MNKLFIDQCSEIQAMRKYLGLDIKEAAELIGYSVRYWQYWENGTKKAPQQALHYLDRLCLFIGDLKQKYNNSKPFKSLPYYLSFEDFQESGFPNPTRYQWQIWQSLTGMLKVEKKVVTLTKSGYFKKSESIFKDFLDFFSNSTDVKNN